MALASPPVLNGRPRKQLSEELDRLDDVINGLEECLPQAVADAARVGIRQAIHDVVKELVSDPATLDALRAALVPEFVPLTPAPRPSPWARLRAFVRTAATKVVSAFGIAKTVASIAKDRVAAKVVKRCTAVKSRVARWTLLALPVKSILGISLAIGFVVAVVSLAAPHHVAAAISGLGAAITAAAIQVGNWLRRRRALLGLN